MLHIFIKIPMFIKNIKILTLTFSNTFVISLNAIIYHYFNKGK